MWYVSHFRLISPFQTSLAVSPPRWKGNFREVSESIINLAYNTHILFVFRLTTTVYVDVLPT